MGRFYAAFAVALALTVVMVAGLMRHFGASPGQPSLWDSDVAVQYSQEYGLVFNEALGGPEHVPLALEIQAELAASLNPEHPDSQGMAALLALHRQILNEEIRQPRGPAAAVALVVGAGGGTRLHAAVAAGIAVAERGLADSTLLDEGVTGRVRTGIGFAPGAAGVSDYWTLRLQEWLDVEAQMREASAPYSSFFDGTATGGPAQEATGLAPSLDVYRLYSTPARVVRGWPAAPVDLVGYVLSTAGIQEPAHLVVGLGQDGSLAYCAVTDHRYCPELVVEELAVVERPSTGLGIVSASALDNDVAPDGGRIGLFNPGSRATGHLEIAVAAVDGSWNATASLGPVPADGARFAFFDLLGDGPAWVVVHEGDERVLQWIGESVSGLGIVTA